LTRLSDVNIDINRKFLPDIVATVFHLPLRSELFDTILFTDVLQYLPTNTETQALTELKRCLKKTGKMIVTAPNAIALFTLLDPDRWLFGNPPYTAEALSELVRSAGLRIEYSTAAGGIWEAIGLLVHYAVAYPLGLILRTGIPSPKRLALMSDAQYDQARERGYTLFIVSSR
jgi:SAM-dependent methyltransferase